jgi:nicotinamide riboside kinase
MENKKKCIVVNMIGGPGVGKSIIASEIFVQLKRNFVSCEISSEYIKRKIREDARKVVQNQIYIFAKQQFQLFGMKDNVDVIITDSPIFLSSVYDDTNCPHLRALIMKEFGNYKNLTYHIERDASVAYEQEGRYQDEAGAKLVDDKVKNFMIENQIEYKTLKGIGQDSLKFVVDDVMKNLN